MKLHFKNIKEFLAIKECCPFCGSRLKPIFINFSRQQNDVPRIKSEIDGDKFSFTFTDVTASHDIQVSIQVDTISNLMKISPLSNDSVVDSGLVMSTFENLGPHIELYCPRKKKCKMQYALVSTSFKCKFVEDGSYIIKIIGLAFESFSMPNLWIQNEWIYDRTSIYSLSNLDAEPLRTQMLDIEALGKDKVLTRVKTLVTFS